MADTLDPIDENDAFDAASLNDRFATLKDRVNAVPLQSNQAKALGPSHISSLMTNTFTQTKVLTPSNAVEGALGGSAWFCDQITKQYPGYNSTDFETGGHLCWQRISDSSGGSGVGTQYLELNMSSLTLGNNNFNSLLILANIEFCKVQKFGEGDLLTPTGSEVLVTAIATVSSTGTRTVHWETLRYTSMPQPGPQIRRFSVDVSHRALLTAAATDIAEVEVLASCLHNNLAATGDVGDLRKAYVRFCQLTAVALPSKVN
tara:strand:- start:630 stop:1409 length:780 start_codon:yes stop_codon:yes gene_type:complete